MIKLENNMALQLVTEQAADINLQALEEFQEHRIEIKKPMTPLAITKAANILRPFPLSHQQYMVDQAIMLGWRGIYPVDPPRQQTSRNTTLEQDLTDTSWAGI